MKVSRKHTKSNQTQTNVIDNWLETHGDPAIDLLVKKNLAIANKIRLILHEKGLKPVDLAKMMNKQKSEISKWLTGQHSFSIKTITAIEAALGCEILFVEQVVNTVVISLPISSKKELFSRANFQDAIVAGEFHA